MARIPRLGIRTWFILLAGIAFVATSILFVFVIVYFLRQEALADAEAKAKIILDRNLATHQYFSRQLKPHIFDLIAPILPDSYFDPVWMSSTFAVRKIDDEFQSLNNMNYYYKEATRNARSPQNEADEFERAFLQELDRDPQLTARSEIRAIDGKPYLVFMRRGEMLEQSCMRCHGKPEDAPGDLLAYYGATRGFYREVGEAISAISIRVPLAEVYAKETELMIILSLMSLTILALLWGGGWWLSDRFVLAPLSAIQHKAAQIANDENHLGEQIPTTLSKDLHELALAFNQMSSNLRQSRDSLEARVRTRTRELEEANRALAIEMVDHKKTTQALQTSEERYALATQGANDGLWDWNLVTNTVYYSSRWKAILGCGDDEIGNTPDEWFNRVHPHDLAHLRQTLDLHLQGQTTHFECEYRIRQADGGYRWTLSRGLALRNGKPYRIAGSQTDITRRKIAEEQLIHDALHESLTGLATRVLFLDRLERTIKIITRNPQYQAAVLFVDLDRFKMINDSLGHRIGDRVLIELAHRLESCVRPTDTVARFGGDEFAILLDDLHHEDDATNAATRVQTAVTNPLLIEGQTLSLSASIGIAYVRNYGLVYEDAAAVMRDADIAMYRAKSLGKARHAIFDATMHAHAVRLLELESGLRRALDQQELELFYQPIVSVRTRQITGIEALIRWRHPEHGLILPNEFIPLAEESGLIVPMGEWVLRTACAQLAQWRAAGFSDLRIAVNFSARQFQDPNLAHLVEQVLREANLTGDALELEITESTAMRDIEQSVRTLGILNRLGVELAIDDFGNSYSAMGRLKHFPFRILKIDHAFLRDIAQDSHNAAITQAIITMARTLNLRVIAEGVETQDQLEFLRAHDCDEMQGHLFSRPASAEGMSRLIQNGIAAQMAGRG